MIKIKKLLFIIVSFLFISNIYAWDSNITGGGVTSGASGVSCDVAYGSCYNKCNNSWFSAFHMRLVYYDGVNYNQIGNTIRLGKYRSGLVTDSTWIKAVFANSNPKIQDWSIVPNGFVPQNNYNFANQLRGYVLNDLNNILNKMGVNKSNLENDIRNGKYPKHKKANGNYNDTGVRLIVEPLYGYSESYSCFSSPKTYFGTVKGIAAIVGSKLYQFEAFTTPVYLQKNDIGYYAPSSGYATAQQAAVSNAGWGVAIFSPWDDIKPDNRCDPGSSKDTIQECCKRLNIDYGNQTNNNTQNLTNAISQEDLKKYCPIKCDKTKEGVEECCTRFNITPNNQTNNNYNYLTHLLTNEELLNSTCDPDYCKYSFEDNLTDDCIISRTGYITDANNKWNCIFKSSNYNNSKLSNDEVNNIRNHFIENINNDYCSIYCTETIKHLFPSDKTETKVGRYLVLFESLIHPSIYPIEYEANKTCRTTSKKGESKGIINYEKFENDINETNKFMVNSYTSGDTKKGKEYKKKLDDIFNQIEQCNNYQITQKFSPNAKFNYEELVYGGTYSLKIDDSRTKTNKKITYYYNGNGNDGSGSYTLDKPTKSITINDCIENNCNSIKNINYSASTWIEYSIDKQYYYKLNHDTQYQYVSKHSGKSFNTKTETGLNYIDMGFPNLPIHYSEKVGKKKFIITTTSFGLDNKFEKYYFLGNTFLNKKYQMKKDYLCSFKVKNDIGDSDITKYTYEDIIFRPISLYSKKNAFPGKNGDGRTPGNNWNNDALIKEYITNNRTVLNYDIYKQDPMYEITLTPTLMKKIRAYNKKKNGELSTLYDYSNNGVMIGTGISGYTSYDDMKCLNGSSIDSGQKCISKKIREFGVIGCGIKDKLTDYKNCNNIEAWD